MKSTHRYFQRISRWICIFLQCITLTKTKKSLSFYQEIAWVTATMCRGKTALWLLSTFTEVEILKQNTKFRIFEMWLTDLRVSIRYSRYSYRYEMQIQCGSGHRDGTAFGCWWTQSPCVFAKVCGLLLQLSAAEPLLPLQFDLQSTCKQIFRAAKCIFGGLEGRLVPFGYTLSFVCSVCSRDFTSKATANKWQT